jgi:enoyl-CoA hydratase/carnithine racemase
MSYKSLNWTINESIGYLMLNHPPANTMSVPLFEELYDLTEKIKKLKVLKGIIISGEGRHFSSGADLTGLTYSIKEGFGKEKNEKFKTVPEFMIKNLKSFKSIEDLSIPVIAAIKGVCIGSAFELALFCHFRLGSTNAVVGLPESTFGLIPGLGGIQKILEHSNKAKAMELIFKGKTINAQEALKTGIIDRIFTKDQLMSSAEELIGIAKTNYRRYNRKDYLHLLDKNLILNK